MALLDFSARLLSCNLTTSPADPVSPVDDMIWPFMSDGSMFVTTMFKSLGRWFLWLSWPVLATLRWLSVLELRFTVTLPVGMAIDMGLVWPARLTGRPSVVRLGRPVGGLPSVTPGLEEELGLLRFKWPPVPLACLLCPDSVELLRLEARFKVDPELAGLRPPDPSRDFPELRPGEEAEDWELVRCLVLLAARPPCCPDSPTVENSYGSLALVVICEPWGNRDSKHNFLK